MVYTVLDEYRDRCKQWNDKVTKRAEVLENVAYHKRCETDRKAKEKAEWTARQQAWAEKKEHEKRTEQQVRRSARETQQRRLNSTRCEPGHGPTRWLWPTARDHPRVFRASTDISVTAKDRDESMQWMTSPAARAQHGAVAVSSPRHAPVE